MILDEFLEFADDTSLVAGTGSAIVGDVIDLGPQQRDIGNGRALYWYVAIGTEVDSAADGSTVNFELVSGSNTTITADVTVHGAIGAQAEDDLVSGRIFQIGVPVEGSPYGRYLGVRVTRGGEAVTAGTFSSGLTLDAHGNKHYPEGNS